MPTTVVVGHGRSPEGKGWGSRIDSCCTVVRMWDWHGWQSLTDYGERYDYGLFVLTPKGLPTFIKHRKAIPSRGWIAYLGKPVSGELPTYAGLTLELVDPQSWVAYGQEIGGAGLTGCLTLTRGCVAAAWAISKAPKDRVDRVVLVGFDNVLAQTNKPVEESFCPEYWKLFNSRWESKMDKAYPVGQPKTATHDMSIELPLLQHLAQQRNVRLEFAQEYWK